MATGHWLLQRQVIATLALIVIVTTGAVLLFTRHEQGQKQQQPVTQGSPQVVYKAAPEPLPSPVAPRPPPAPRLKTGTNIWTHEKGSGRGTLRVNNGTSYDAAVTLLDEETGMVRRLVYIRAREVTTLNAIAPCRCRLFFALGTDWNALTEEFGQDSSFSMFDELLQFSESETEKGVRWATFSITLHPVREGKAKTTRLSKEEFERQIGKRYTGKASS